MFGQCRGPGVTQPVGDGRSLPVGRGAGLALEADAAVVDAEPLLGIQVIPDQGAPGAAHHQLADLGRTQPVDVDVGHGVVGQRERQVPDAGMTCPQGIRAVRRDLHRPQPFGEDEVEDGQVVRGEVPENIDVRLHQPQVDPDRIDEQDSPSDPVGDQFPDLQDGGGIAVGVVRHQDEPPLLRFLDHLQSLQPAVGEGLLDQHVLPGLQRRQGDAMVRVGRRRNRNSVDVGRVQQLVNGLEDGNPALGRGELGGPRLVQVDDACQLPVGAGGEVPRQIGPPVARTYDRCPHQAAGVPRTCFIHCVSSLSQYAPAGTHIALKVRHMMMTSPMIDQFST